MNKAIFDGDPEWYANDQTIEMQSNSPVNETANLPEAEIGKHLVPNEEAFGQCLGVELEPPAEPEVKIEHKNGIQLEQVRLPVINDQQNGATQNSFYFNKYRMKTTKELQSQQAILGHHSSKVKEIHKKSPQSYEQLISKFLSQSCDIRDIKEQIRQHKLKQRNQ